MSSSSLQSYRHFMKENLFDCIDIDPKNCYIPDGTISLDDIKYHCEQYEQKIKDAGGIDFQLLGVGRNGHIGFNEPGSHISSVTRLITDPMAEEIINQGVEEGDKISIGLNKEKADVAIKVTKGKKKVGKADPGSLPGGEAKELPPAPEPPAE